jgi:hypothetical protein
MEIQIIPGGQEFTILAAFLLVHLREKTLRLRRRPFLRSTDHGDCQIGVIELD